MPTLSKPVRKSSAKKPATRRLVTKVRKKAVLAKKKVARRPKKSAAHPHWIGVLAEGTSLLLPSVGLAMVGGMLIFGTVRETPLSAKNGQPAPERQVASQPLHPASSTYEGPKSILESFSRLQDLPKPARIAAWSDWLKQNYGSFRAGWSKLPPNSDRMEWFPSKLDCTTFVETAMAFVTSRQVADIPTQLSRIRYKGSPSFEARNHFPETDWTPNSIAAGFLVDRTAELAQSWGARGTVSAHKRIDRESFVRGIASVGDRGHDVAVELISKQQALDHLAGFPDASVVNFVRNGWDSRTSIVSHQGLVVRRQGEPWLIHVSSAKSGVIRELPLRNYLQKNNIFGLQVLELR